MQDHTVAINRRKILKLSAGAAAIGAGLPILCKPAIAQSAPLKVGLMLPFTGTFAAPGKSVDNGFRLYLAETGNSLGGRRIEFFVIDDQADPSKAPDNMNRLVSRDNVDVVIGTVHSGVQMAMLRIARESGKLMIIPNAGADAATRSACAPNIFRTSFTNWQPNYPAGKVMVDAGLKNVITISWKYASGEEQIAGFKQGFTEAGGKILTELWLPFPEVEFQSYFTQIAERKPDGVYCFFAGGGAVKFVKDYAAAGLKKAIPLYGSGFLTDGTLQAQGDAAEGLKTTLHYADDLDNPKDKTFRAAYRQRYSAEPDVYAVQGYDAAALLDIGVTATKGDVNAKDALYAAMTAAKIDSPRGPISFSSSRNVVQDIYLREVRNGKNTVVKVVHKALADPGTGCKLV
jgi:branched-chain amino acid transport system substrate-binding protein